MKSDPSRKRSPPAGPSGSTVTQNILANYAGRVWSGLIGLVFVPVYIRFLGIEVFGLIGVYLSLMALLSVLDMGLSTTLSRELARLSAAPGDGREARNLVRTLEVIYWGVGAAVGLGVYALASPIARDWLNVQGSSAETVEDAVAIMGFVAAMEWPIALYSGGLLGLQRQVLLNGVRAAMATVQSVGVVLVLWLVSPTITAYFKWQILTGALQTLLLARCLWSALPGGTDEKTGFRKELLVKNWRFAAGMTGISMMVAILTQMDKIILSRLLTLEKLGYYVLACTIAGALTQLVHPIFAALFPRFSQLVAEDREAELSELYHKGCRLLSSAVVPIGVTAALFSSELLSVWIGDPSTARGTHLLLSVILVGTTLNAVMTLPYTLQLSYGWTKLSFYKNAAAVTLLVPSLIWMAVRYGGIGAAFVWVFLNAAYFAIEIPVMHRRLLKTGMRRWYLFDVGIPAAVSVFVGALSRAAMPENLSTPWMLLWVASTVVFMLVLSVVSVPDAGSWLRRCLVK